MSDKRDKWSGDMVDDITIMIDELKDRKIAAEENLKEIRESIEMMQIRLKKAKSKDLKLVYAWVIQREADGKFLRDDELGFTDSNELCMRFNYFFPAKILARELSTPLMRCGAVEREFIEYKSI